MQTLESIRKLNSLSVLNIKRPSVVSFIKEVNQQLAKRFQWAFS